MRTPPEHVLKELRAHDPGLGLEATADGSGWFFTHNGRRLARWVHRDGTPACNDLSADEALAILAGWDNRRHGHDRLKAFDRQSAAAAEVAARDKQRLVDDTGAESRKRIGFEFSGPKPFVSGLQSQPPPAPADSARAA